jgi:hypothetical protein
MGSDLAHAGRYLVGIEISQRGPRRSQRRLQGGDHLGWETAHDAIFACR